jgi:isopenicillin N synthase-like dioxygenase
MTLPINSGILESNTALREVSLSGILKSASFHIATLLEACGTDGCFYLSLEDLDADRPEFQVFDMAKKIIKLSDDFFQLPAEEKLMWEMDKWGDMQIGGWVIKPLWP